MTQKHTPLPWLACAVAGDGWNITTNNYKKIANGLTEIDADFTVRAVNCHEELVSLIEDLLKWDEAQKANPYQLDVEQPTDTRARTILAKARGEA